MTFAMKLSPHITKYFLGTLNAMSYTVFHEAISKGGIVEECDDDHKICYAWHQSNIFIHIDKTKTAVVIAIFS